MNTIESLVNELKRESLNTQKMIACIPDNTWDWQPHKKSSTLRKLAVHIAQLSGYPGIIARTDYLDFAEGTLEQPEFESAADLVKFVQKQTADSVAAVEKLSEEYLDKTWILRRGEHVIFEGKKGELIRMMGMSHQYHHRGQLSVYLRVLNVPIPGMYGPSADE